MEETYKLLLLDKCVKGYSTTNDYELLLLTSLLNDGFVYQSNGVFYLNE